MLKPGNIKSICLVRLSALGDVVLVLPLVRHLQQSLPGVKITWVVGRGVLDIVRPLEKEGVELVAIDKPRRLGDYLALRRRLAGRTFDALLCLQASWRANWLYPCIRAKRKIGYGADRAKDLHGFFVSERVPAAKPHLADGFLQFAEALGLGFPKKISWGLTASEEAAAWAQSNLPTSFVAVSPCSSKPERDWPVERYAEILRWLHNDKGTPIVLLGGPSARERQFVDALKQQAGIEVTDLVGTTKIPQLIAALAKCRVLLAPDTGAVHIGNALDRRVVGLYAVAPASRTGPYGNLDYCVDCFDEGLRSLLGRDPSSVPWAQRVHHPQAMSLISVAAVKESLERALS